MDKETITINKEYMGRCVVLVFKDGVNNNGFALFCEIGTPLYRSKIVYDERLSEAITDYITDRNIFGRNSADKVETILKDITERESVEAEELGFCNDLGFTSLIETGAFEPLGVFNTYLKTFTKV